MSPLGLQLILPAGVDRAESARVNFDAIAAQNELVDELKAPYLDHLETQVADAVEGAGG